MSMAKIKKIKNKINQFIYKMTVFGKFFAFVFIILNLFIS